MAWIGTRQTVSNDNCASIEPLLPLYADGMASPGEVRRVELHLPLCGGCRETLAWMQATHRALAARPIALPPADLHSRIAEAIAASATPSLRPARLFTLRPAYAAAASLTVLGVALSYSLWHAPAPVVAPPPTVKPPVVAVLPRVKTPALTLPAKTPVRHPLVAANIPAAIKPVPARKTPAAVSVTREPQHLAVNAPAPVVHPAPVPVKFTVKASAHHAQPSQLIAKVTVPAAKHAPVVPENAAPKISETQHIASRVTEPARVPVIVLPPTVTTPPAVRTASAASNPSAKFGDILGSEARAQIDAINHEAPAVTRFAVHESGRSAVNMMHTLDNEHFGYVDAVHGK